MNRDPFQDRLRTAHHKALGRLCAERAEASHWTGDLSSSALSTATAVIALALARPDQAEPAARGLQWLAANLNADGGWGDTTRSFSNLSTTALVWSAFGAVPGADSQFASTCQRAERWLAGQISSAERESPGPHGSARQQTGNGPERAGLDREALSQAVIARYGKDRTFSVPILTACALSGRLGSGPEAWRRVIALPFELAALPHQFFAAVRLPVVSYALPALIAIGQVRHCHRPSRNPLLRLVRALTRRRTLRLLEQIQPSNGGFLEATPLTSFVVMSLAGSGQAGHTVTAKGVDFLLRSQRPDGSWPIDTNLATWVTTLSIDAIGGVTSAEPGSQNQACLDWLLRQQYRAEHPYTHAPPGAWAWTDLPGGVPDADDTAGGLLAIHALSSGTGRRSAAVIDAAQAGLHWLLKLQNRDGGIPTFCRGWGTLPFDRSSADLTAHAIRAWLAWAPEVPPKLATSLSAAVERGLGFLASTQRDDGAWVPLWFGNQLVADDQNPCYGTARVVVALAQARRKFPAAERLLGAGLDWLVRAQNADGGWGGAGGAPSSVEETALAVEALAVAQGDLAGGAGAGTRLPSAIRRGATWLIERVESGQYLEPSPIGFYFARLWYFEKLYPQIFTVAALRAAQNAG